MAIVYRIRQFIAAITASVSATELELVSNILTPAELLLFKSMPLYDRRHCLDVYYTLWRAGQRDPLLLRAALFHDCGKIDDAGRPLSLPWYMFASALKAIAPALYRILAASGRGPLRPIRIYAEHAWRGSRQAAAAGSSAEMVETIRHYHDQAPTGRAALLKWADEQH